MNVGDRYLSRLAVVYVRQSTAMQVRQNEGSRQYQEAQRDLALRYGWKPEQVELITEDLGLSGLSPDRPGYCRMLSLIAADRVGGLFVSEISRGGRDEQALFQLFDLLARHDVLLFVDGRPSDPNDDGQMFGKKIEALLAARDNRTRVETLYRGRLAKARHGKAVTQPPVGYVMVYENPNGKPLKTGQWVKDPDARVQRAIEALFETFREERSLPRTARALNAKGVLIPARRGRLTFSTATVYRVQQFVKHPAYAGTYVFGQVHRRRQKKRRDTLLPLRLTGQIIEINNHHEPYISEEEYRENQETLRLNRWTSPLGPGASVLQGLIRCARHRGMTVNYSGPRDTGRWVFHCRGEYFRGGRHCMTVPGRVLERWVVNAVLEKLAAPTLADIRRAWGERQRDVRRAEGAARQQLRQASEACEALKRRYFECDEAHRHVRLILERELEERTEQLERLARSTEVERRPPHFTADAWNALEHLSRDVRAIWEASSTDLQDRKQLLRIVVTSVIVESIDSDMIQVRIAWKDGTPDTPVEIHRTGYFRKLIATLHAQGVNLPEILEIVNAKGGVTAKGRPWCHETVRKVIASGLYRTTTEEVDPDARRD